VAISVSCPASSMTSASLKDLGFVLGFPAHPVRRMAFRVVLKISHIVLIMVVSCVKKDPFDKGCTSSSRTTFQLSCQLVVLFFK